MASSSALIALFIVLGCAAAASATTFTVGDAQGWTVGTDYTGWTSGKTFAVGDKLVFNYASQAHTVTEVTKSEYDACSSTNAKGDNSGTTTITLTAGAHYYICTVGTHCASGMKLAVTAGDSSSSGTPAAGTPPTTPSASTPAGASARLQPAPSLRSPPVSSLSSLSSDRHAARAEAVQGRS